MQTYHLKKFVFIIGYMHVSTKKYNFPYITINKHVDLIISIKTVMENVTLSSLMWKLVNSTLIMKSVVHT